MSGLSALVEGYTSLMDRFSDTVSSTIDRMKYSYSFKNRYGMKNINMMSAALTPDGLATHQSPGESIDGLEDKVRRIHPAYRRDVKENLLLGKKIDLIYQDFINSYEGQEFIKYLRSNGNGTRGTGSVDDIFVINKEGGMIAATTPDSIRKNLIINRASIISYARTLSNYTGLSIVDSIKGIIAHEIRHIYGQTRAERRGPEHKVEYNNDMGNVEFYTGLAKKDVANSDFYLAKAKLFTVRYSGSYRKNMDNMIDDTRERISRFYGNNSKDYRQAA